MKKVTIENEDISVGIEIEETVQGVTWKEVMCLVIDNLMGHTYVSEELENLRDKWSD